MPTPQKVERVREIKEQLTGSAAALVSDYRGVTVKEITELRAALREAEATFTVVKNTLTKLAAAEAGLQELADLLDGPTAITFVRGDVVVAAKRLADVAKRIPALEVKAAVMEGRVLGAEQARALATLESREVLLAKMAGMAQASMSRAAYAFNAVQARFLSLLEAYREKVPAAETPSAEPRPEAPAVETEDAASPDEAETPGEVGAGGPESPDDAEAADANGQTQTEAPDEADAAQAAGEEAEGED